MRRPTDGDESALERARANLPRIYAEAPTATDLLAHRLCGDKAPQMLADLGRLLPVLAEACQNEVWDDSARPGINVELAYTVGEHLRQRFGGAWVTDDVPLSPSFARPVIAIPVDANGAVQVDVFQKMFDFVHTSPPRDLVAFVAPIERDLARITGR